MLSPVVFWLRRDLRLSDHRALLEAARRGDGNVMPVFVIDPELAGVAPAQFLQPGALEGFLAPPGYVAPVLDAAVESSDALARLVEACQLARVSLSEEGVA